MPLKHFLNLYKIRSEKEKKLTAAISNIVGKRPKNINLYQLAIRHVSVARVNQMGVKESNERLEYLGDAVLGAVVADFLFKKYPYKDEGFLTEIRSRLVSRESLNELGKKVGLEPIVELDTRQRDRMSHKSLYGDALEALVGAVYLDRGFMEARRFVLIKLIKPYFNLNEVINNIRNFKSKLIEWSQKENIEIRFELLKVADHKKHKEFTAQVFVEDKPMGKGYGLNKKKAEQDAAHKTMEMLNLIVSN